MDDLPSIGSFRPGWGMGSAVVHTDTRHGHKTEVTNIVGRIAALALALALAKVYMGPRFLLLPTGGVAAVMCTVTVMASEVS